MGTEAAGYAARLRGQLERAGLDPGATSPEENGAEVTLVAGAGDTAGTVEA